MDPSAVIMRLQLPHRYVNGAIRAPLVERLAGNANIMTSFNTSLQPLVCPKDKPSQDKQPQQQQPTSYQCQYATPNNEQKNTNAVVSATSCVTQRHGTAHQNTAIVGCKGTTPFKSPISLCFERMLGAGKWDM
jgi:hypothetical protein